MLKLKFPWYIMKKYSYFLFALVFMTAGCGPGDKLAFHHPGDLHVVGHHLCIPSSPGDHLSYYLLSYSADQYQSPLAYEDNIDRKYPDTCFIANVKKPADYNLLYIINGMKYRVDFVVNEEGDLKIIRR